MNINSQQDCMHKRSAASVQKSNFTGGEVVYESKTPTLMQGINTGMQLEINHN